jgi:photosystem II stability/assembly factor-like uncharacterized protein
MLQRACGIASVFQNSIRFPIYERNPMNRPIVPLALMMAIFLGCNEEQVKVPPFAKPPSQTQPVVASAPLPPAAEPVPQTQQVAVPEQLSPASTPVESPAVGKWTVQTSGLKDDLLDVAFVNEKVGMAVGSHRTIVRTTDGGTTWTRAIERVQDGPLLKAVVFADEKTGYAITEIANTILHTGDGGATWAAIPLPDVKYHQSRHYCTHAVHGSAYYYLCWGLSGSHLFKTENGGKSWAEHKMKPALRLGGLGGGATVIAFPDGKNGCFFNTKPSEFIFNWGVSTDEGRTWVLDKFNDKVNRGTNVHLQFVDKDHGWFLPEYRDAIYKTTDGGRTWSAQKIVAHESPANVNLHFVSAKVGHVLIGNLEQPIWQTIDGGKSWNSLGKLDRLKNLRGLSFPSGRTGWVVGDGGYIACYSAGTS